MIRGIDLKQAYARGENISALLRAEVGDGANSETIIETAYDLQAGSYVASQQNPERRKTKRLYTDEIVKIMQRLGRPRNVLEAGVEEATTLSYVLQGLGSPAIPAAGIDLCWSRLRWARRWLDEQQLPAVKLAMATLTHLPFADSAFDVVYTSHSIEPNGGKEAEILAELYRVTGRYLILLEPAYELAEPRIRARMEDHGYCRGLPAHAQSQGMKVIEHGFLPMIARPDNPTAVIIIEKDLNHSPSVAQWCCPVSHAPLQLVDQFWYSETSFLAYPELDGVPCLRSDKGIVASQFLDHRGQP